MPVQAVQSEMGGKSVQKMYSLYKSHVWDIRGTTPYGHHSYIPSDATWHKIQEYSGLGVGVSTVFEIFGHFLTPTPTSNDFNKIESVLRQEAFMQQKPTINQ